jgi:hypothetical protein
MPLKLTSIGRVLSGFRISANPGVSARTDRISVT